MKRSEFNKKMLGDENKLSIEQIEEKYYASIVNDDYINSFINDSHSFISSSSNDINNVSYKNSKDLYESKKQSFVDMSKRANIIKGFLKYNPNAYSSEQNEKLSKYLDAYDSDSRNVIDAFKSKSDYFSQWENEDAYNYWLQSEEEKKKYSAMSLTDIEKEYAQIEAEEKAFKDTNGGKLINYLKKAGSYFSEGKAGKSGSAVRAQSEMNIDTIDDFTRKKEKLNIYRKQRAMEELLGGLSDEQIGFLDEIGKADTDNQTSEFLPAIGVDSMGMQGWADATEYERKAGTSSREKLLGQLKEKYPDKAESELDELINNMVELRKNQVNEEEQAKRDAEMKETASDNPISSFIISRGANILGGTTGLAELYLQRDNEYGYDTNAAGFMLTNDSNTIDEQIQLDHDWVVEIGDTEVDGFDLAYNIGTSVVDNVGRLAMSGGNKTASSMMMFAQSTTQSIIDSKEKGYSDEKALTMGLLNGTFEALAEKISLDIILGSNGSALRKLAKSFVAEGGEEITSNWLNRIADEIANGKHSELSQMYEKYVREGSTKAQALTEVICSIIGEDFKTFLVGGLSGLVLGGAGTAIGAGTNTAQINATAKNMSESDIVALQEQARALGVDASDIDVGSVGPWGGAPSTKKVANLIGAVQEKQSQTDRQKVIDTAKSYGLNVSLYNTQTESGFKSLQKSIANIEKEISTTVNEAADSILKTALADRIEELGESRGKALYIADSYLRIENGETLDQYREASLNSEAAKTAVNEYYTLGENMPQWVVDTRQKIDNVYKDIESRFITPINKDTNVKSNDNSNDNGNVETAESVVSKPVATQNTVQVPVSSATVNGKGVNVEGIAEVSKNGATVIVDGKSVDLKNVTFDNPSTEAAYKFAAGMETTEKAKAALALYNPKFDRNSDFRTAFNEYYNAGLKGIGSFKDIDKYYTFAHSFPASWREAVFNAGRSNKVYKSGVNKLYKTRNLSKTQKSQLEVLDLLGKKYGVSFLVFDELNDNGSLLNGLQIAGTNKVAVSLEADGKLYLRTAGHECFHIIEEWNQKAAAELTDKVIGYLKQSEGYNYSEQVKRYAKIYGVDAETAEGLSLIHSEMAADSMFDVFSNEKFIKDIVTENRTLAQKIKNFLTDLISELREMITHFHASEEMNALRTQTKALEDINSSFISALETATKNMHETLSDKTKNTATKSGVRYSLKIVHSNGTIEEIDNARQLTNEQAIKYLKMAKRGELFRDSYIPIRKDTPQVIIDTLEEINKVIENNSLIIQVSKARQAMNAETLNKKAKKRGSGVRGHSLVPEQIVEILNNLDNPNAIIYQTNRVDKNGVSLPNNVAVFVEYDNNGKESVAIIEFDSSINPKYIGKGVGDENYHTVVTIFEPDVERNGVPYDYMNELLLNPNNYELEIVRRQPTRSATGEKHPNTSNDLPSTENILPQNSQKSSGADTKNRRSIKLTQKSQQALEEYPELKNALQSLQNELSLTKGYVPEGKVIHKYAAQLKKGNPCGVSVAEIESDLREIYSVLSSMSGSEGYEYAADLTLNLAKKMLDSSRVLDDLNAEKKELRERLTSAVKGHKWYLSPQMRAEIEYHYDSYGNFHKKMFGKGFSFSENSTDYLDSDWSELCAAVPELLDSDTLTVEQPLALLEAFAVTEYEYGLFDDYQYDAQAKYIATDIMNNLAAVPEADTLIGKIKSAEYDRIAKLKSENAEKISKLKQKYAEDIERTAAEEKTHYKLQIKQKIESEKAAKARKSIETTMVRLSGMLANGTKSRHIPLKLIDTVRDLCYTITLNRASQAKLGENLNKVEALYAALNAGKDGVDGEIDNQFLKNAYDEYVHNLIHQLNTQLRHKTIGDMTLEELILVDETVKAVAQRVARGNELHIESKNVGVEETANAIGSELGAPKVKRYYKWESLNKNSDKLEHESWKFLKPIYAWRMIGSDTFTELMRNLRKGEATWSEDDAEAREKRLEISEKYHKDVWANDKKELTLASGDTFTFSVQQLMMLYVASQREQYIPHLIGHKRGEESNTKKGGFVFEDAYKIVADKEKVKDEDGNKKKEYKKHAEERKWRKRDAGTHHLTESDLELIAETLTSEQRAYANEMRDYLAKDLAVKGNEITRKLYDMNKFTEDLYFPIKVAQEYIDGTPLKDSEVRSVLSTSIMKDLTDNANTPILLRNFDDMWAEHVEQMANFHSFALPLDDFTRVFNCQSSTGSPVSVKSRIETACGKGAVSYIEQFIKDVNGGVHASSAPTFLNKAISKFQKGAVFASASVAIQQPSAIARALAEVDIKYFAKTTGTGFKAIVSKKEYNELMKYAPIARVKSMGFFDNSIGQSTKEWLLAPEYKGIKNKAVALVKDSSYRDEVLSFVPGKMDEITWCHIWNAVKEETKDKYNLSGEELLKKSGERFTEVIELTQVYDSVFSKSEYMRSKDTGAKMAMAFMAEPTTALNMLVDAAANLKHGDKKKGGRYIGAFVASVIFNNILKAFITAARDDDEEKTYIEKYISSVAGGVVTDINPLTLLPFVKDMLSIFNGYSIERADMSLVQDLYEAVESLWSDTESGAGKVFNVAGALAAFLGLPVKNVVRDVRAAYNFGAGIFGFEKENEDGEKVPAQKSIFETSGEGIKKALKDEFSEGFLNKVKNSAEEMFFGTSEEQLYNAIKQGNYKAYEKLLKEEYGGDSAKVNTAIRNGLVEYDERVTQAAEARRDGNGTLYSKCVEGLSADGFSNENIRKAVDKVYTELMDDGEKEKNEKAYSLYKYEDLNNAIETGGDVQNIIDDIVSAAVKNGKTEDEAIENVRKEVTSYWKPLYIESSDYEQEEIQKLLDDTELYSDLDDTLYGWEKDYTTEKYKPLYLEASRSEKERIISELEDTGLYTNASKTARGWEVAVLKEEYESATSQTEKDRIKAEIWNTGYYKYYSSVERYVKEQDADE